MYVGYALRYVKSVPKSVRNMKQTTANAVLKPAVNAPKSAVKWLLKRLSEFSLAIEYACPALFNYTKLSYRQGHRVTARQLYLHPYL